MLPEFKNLTPFAVAAKKLGQLKAVTTEETIPLEKALFRIISTPVVAPFDLPAVDNCAVDGFAVRADGINQKTIGGEVKMGHSPPVVKDSSIAFSVATGSAMPQGLDAVVMEEHCSVRGNSLTLNKPAVLGASIRKKGEDFKKGKIAIPAGTRLRPQELATAAALGLTKIRVKKPLRVAIIAVGDELLRPSQKHHQAKLYDANTPALIALLKCGGFQPHSYGIVRDHEPTIKKAIEKCIGSHHAILIGGGSSSPNKDMVSAVLVQMEKQGIAKYQFKKCAIKPARPFSVATIGKVVVFNMPGNVVATNVVFMMMVKPALDLLSGRGKTATPRFKVKADFTLTKKLGRREWHRGKLTANNKVSKNKSGAGVLSSLTNADGIIELTESQTTINRNDEVSFIPFGSLWL